ncbi:hypothetical protein MT418_8641 [Batrachochytrium dendrobatidis]
MGWRPTTTPGTPFLLSEQMDCYDHPLIIRSLSDTITMDEHMVCSLPEPVYDNPVSRPNTSGRIWKKPTHVFLWSDFKQSVVDWIGANHHQHSQRVQKPVFVSGIIITEEVQSLQPFIKLNLLNISAKCFIPPSEFKARRQITSCVGEPDHLMTRDGEIVAIVEEKGNWALPISDIVNSYDTERTRASALDQLYHYMRLNHRQYGILSSYENTWFVYRNQECAVCEELQGHETLYVSEGISFTVRTPTVQQCLSYFNSIVNHNHMDSPPHQSVRLELVLLPKSLDQVVVGYLRVLVSPKDAVLCRLEFKSTSNPKILMLMISNSIQFLVKEEAKCIWITMDLAVLLSRLLILPSTEKCFQNC